MENIRIIRFGSVESHVNVMDEGDFLKEFGLALEFNRTAATDDTIYYGPFSLVLHKGETHVNLDKEAYSKLSSKEKQTHVQNILAAYCLAKDSKKIHREIFAAVFKCIRKL